MHKISAHLIWESSLEGPNFSEDARKQLLSFLPENITIRSLKIEPRPKKHKMKILGEFGLQEVFDKISQSEERIEFISKDKSFYVRMNSQRYWVFKENPKCVACGIVGEKFLLEQHPNDKNPHFNLYAVEDGEYVLMTKDHIHAKAFGGEDRHYNYQTMCAVCNNLKGSDYIPLDGIAELRKVFKENKLNLPKKKLNTLLNETREKYAIEHPELNVEKHKIVSKIDMNVMESDSGELLAISVYEAPQKCKGWKHVASIKKGYPLQDVKIENDKVLVPYDSRYFEVYKGQTTIG